MGAIATVSLNLVVNTKGWGDKLKSAGVEAKGFATQVAGIAGKAGASLAKLGPAAGAAALGIAGVGVAAVAAGGALATAGLDRIDALSDAAQRLGVTTESLSELRHAANLTGSSADDLDGALEKLSANLGDAAQKGTPAGDALERLGLDAKQLAAEGPDKAFKAIVEGFGKIPNASERASVAMDIFGKGGIKILNTLSSGDQLGQLAEEARKFGLSVSQVDAAKVGAAKDALDRAGGAIEGLGNKLAVGLAPFIEAAAGAFADFLGPAIDQAGGVEGAIGAVASAVGFVADAAYVAQQGFTALFAGIAEGAAKTLGFLGLAGAETAKVFAEDLRRAADSFDTPPSKRITEFLEEVKSKANAAATESAKVATENAKGANAIDSLGKSISDLTKKLKDQADAFGLTAEEADIFKLAQQGATEAQLADAKAQAERLRALAKSKEESDQLKDFAKGLNEGTRTAGEVLKDELAKISKARDAGLIDDQTARRAGLKASGESGLFDSKPRFSGALELGSSAAYSAIVSATRGKGPDGIKQLAKSSDRTAENTGQLVKTMNTFLTRFGGKPTELNFA